MIESHQKLLRRCVNKAGGQNKLLAEALGFHKSYITHVKRRGYIPEPLLRQLRAFDEANRVPR